MLAPCPVGLLVLGFPGFREANNPFHDKRVREAVSLVIDRRAINQAESGGMGKPAGNWINNDVQYAVEWPEFERDVKRAKELTEGGRLSQWLRSRLADSLANPFTPVASGSLHN